MSPRIFSVLIGFLAASAVPLAAQGTAPRSISEPLLDDWRWTEFSTDDGLPSADVYAFAEDGDGIEWGLTTEGLAWFVGSSWHALDQRAGIPTAGLSALQADPRGDVVVVADGRVYRGDVRGFAPVPVENDGQPLHVRLCAERDWGTRASRSRSRAAQRAVHSAGAGQWRVLGASTEFVSLRGQAGDGSVGGHYDGGVAVLWAILFILRIFE